MTTHPVQDIRDTSKYHFCPFHKMKQVSSGGPKKIKV